MDSKKLGAKILTIFLHESPLLLRGIGPLILKKLGPPSQAVRLVIMFIVYVYDELCY